MNGGTVSMWVEKTISGDECPGHVAKTFDRLDSTGNWFASNPLRRNSWHKKSPTASSFGVIDSMSTSCRVSANLSLIHISEPTRLLSISYSVFCLKKKK